MTGVADLQNSWGRNPAYRKAYEATGQEFDRARAMIEVRVRAGLTQAELARRMKTTQSVIARLEGGRVRPSTRTLEKLARATGSRLRISFEPAEDAA
jgi:transcriptional regulator with XRE-family HTH domain